MIVFENIMEEKMEVILPLANLILKFKFKIIIKFGKVSN